MLKKTLASTLIIASLIGTGAYAGEPETGNAEATIGFGTGAAVGALVGGPFGFVIGAAAGAILGDNVHQRDALATQADDQAAQLAALRAELETAQSERIALEQDRAALVAELAERAATPAAAPTFDASLAMDVLFRTNSPALGDTTQQQLAELAKAVKEFPGLQVKLEGHADRRGSADANLKLSAARADAVRQALIAAGVPAERIEVVSVGAAQARAEVSDIDGLALDRRVSIQLRPAAADQQPAVSLKM